MAERTKHGSDPQAVRASEARFLLELPCRLSNLRIVRSLFGAWLERTGASRDERFEILLAVHEACANAIEHPQRPRRHVFELSAGLCGQTLCVTVRDHGLWRVTSSGRLRGRGLKLIAGLMHLVDIERGDVGTSVHMSRRLVASREAPQQGPSQRGRGRRQRVPSG